MKYDEIQASNSLELQLIFGKHILEMVTVIDNDKWLKAQTLPFEFNGHKYKITIEKDNGDE
ncbi:hypothetical protein PAF15_01390 [Weissella koreensis]|uniref:hypothetical protein n=1 Tax=Weissella koreensis TaxID=165096 RepID=UPI0022BA4593|nr:hypothetical protein [Weissella koreensis]MCZ9310631.1 hypothetical protein [Weissella koreensis]